jgi:hypothetical protein
MLLRDPIARGAISIVLLAAAPAAPAAVTVVRDDAERIVRVEIDTGPFGQTGRKSGGSYKIEALPGEDVRGGAARLVWEMPVTGGLGNGLLRAEGLPIETSVPLARDAVTGAAIAPTPGQAAPSAETFAALATPSANEILFAMIACTGIGFPDPAVAALCGAFWLIGAAGESVPIEPPAAAAYREVPAERSAREQALLGCGAAYGTSCDEDGVDLRLADAGVLHQWFPGLATVLPDEGDSDVVRRVAWNWYAAQLMRRGVEPGVGDAADCTFETPDGCADLDVAGPRFPARRVLPDEPIAGPEIRWEWEHGTTFELGSVEVEGDVSPQLLTLLVGSGVQHVHVTGPFADANGEPDAAVYWVPEPTGALALPTAAGLLLALRRRCAR